MVRFSRWVRQVLIVEEKSFKLLRSVSFRDYYLRHRLFLSFDLWFLSKKYVISSRVYSHCNLSGLSY